MANTTLNPSDKAAAVTLSGGNLIATSTSASGGAVRTTDRQVLGKFYWECTANTMATTGSGVGIHSFTGALVSYTSTPGTCGIMRSGQVYNDGNFAGINYGVQASGTVFGIAVDCTARLIWFRVTAAGLWNNSASANPATGVGGVSIPWGHGLPIYPSVGLGNGAGEQFTANFGDTAFTGAVPSGYTSGFTAGTSVPTNAIASQALAEHWLTTDPAAQITQVSLEHWASVASGNLQAVVTQVLLEHWTSVASVVPAAGGPMVTMIH